MSNFQFVSQKLVKTIKRCAKSISRECGLTHVQALDSLSKSEGFNHWHHLIFCAKKSQDISRNSVIVRFSSFFMNSTKSFLVKSGFQEIDRSLKANEFIYDHKNDYPYLAWL